MHGSLRMRPRRAGLIGALIIVALFGVGGSPFAVGALGAGAAAPRAGGSLAPPALAGTAAPLAAGARPAVSPLPCNPMIPWPAWGNSGDGFLPTPSITYQSGCGGLLFAGQDEVHLSLLSDVASSGDRFTVPIRFPVDHLDYERYGGMYISAVVKGDPNSPWNESLVEVSFVPGNNSTNSAYRFESEIAVYSMVNRSGATQQCPGGWLPLAWNSSYWCEGSDFGNLVGVVEPTAVHGGDWMNVTFLGVPKTVPLEVWANDSTTSSASFSYVFNSTNTGTYNFTPASAYANETGRSSSLLAWGMGEGDGINYDLCPASSIWAACNSYDAYYWAYVPPPEFGIPQYWNGTGYGGYYQYLGFESSSGLCSYIAGASSSTVALCDDVDTNGGTGYYPYFSYNGSRLDFGGVYNWTTWDLGGASVQFNSAGTVTPIIPMYDDELTDSSLGGYLPGNRAFNVSVRVQTVGNVKNVSLNYEAPGSSTWSKVAMTRDNGTLLYGYYNATVPADPTNGTTEYWVYSLDTAGENATSQLGKVVRGPLPTFSVELSINPRFCGTITINGSVYRSGDTAHLTPGPYAISQDGCYPYIDPVYFPSTNLLVLHDGTELLVRGNGNLELSYTFNPPTLHLRLNVVPGSCAATATIGGSTYSNGATVYLTWNQSYALSEDTCASYEFAGYSGSTDVNATDDEGAATLLITENGSLSVNFVPQSGSFPILFLVAPGGCGGKIDYAHGLYENDTSIDANASSVPISPDPCRLDGFKWWDVSGGISYSNGDVTLTGEGEIEMVQYYLTIITVLTEPTGCGGVYIDGTNFTNGGTDVVANNSTHTISVYSCPGYREEGIGTTGGLSLVGDVLNATGSGDLEVSFASGTVATAFVGFETNPPYCGSIGFDGQLFYDTNFTQAPIGANFSLSATPCPEYGFLKWEAAGEISIVGDVATINGPGSITADFTGLVPVYLTTSPYNCGAIVLGGRSYYGNATPTFPIGSNLTLGSVSCPGFVFSKWVYSNGAQLGGQGAGAYVVIGSTITLQADFEPQSYLVAFTISPSNCGHLFVNDRVQYSGTVLPMPAGVYPISVTPCAGNAVVGYQILGNLSVVADTLYVNGSGNLTILIAPTPPELTLDVPGSTAVGLTVTLAAAIAVPIYPYNYTYNWSFGDGASASTTVPTVYHTYSSAGTFTVRLTVVDPLGRTATANGTISVSSAPSTTALSAILPVAAAIGFAVVLVAVAWWYGRGGGPPPESEGGPAPELSEESGPVFPGPSDPSLDETLPKEP